MADSRFVFDTQSYSSPTLVYRYANSLYQVSQESNEIAKTLEDLERMTILLTNKDFNMISQCPHIPFSKMANMIKAILSRIGVGSVVQNLVLTLCSNHRLRLFGSVFKTYKEIEKKIRGIQVVDVYHRIDGIAQEVKEAVDVNLKKLLLPGQQVEITYHPTPSITAGIRLAIGEVNYDMTVDSILNKIIHEAKTLDHIS